MRSLIQLRLSAQLAHQCAAMVSLSELSLPWLVLISESRSSFVVVKFVALESVSSDLALGRFAYGHFGVGHADAVGEGAY